MRSFKRTDRLDELIQRELSQLIKDKMNDPRLGLVTVVKVKVSRDLAYAKVYVSTLGDEKANEELVLVLSRAAGYLRTLLAQRIQIRSVPTLQFIFDDSQLHSNRISQLLKDLPISDESPQEKPEE